MATQLCTFQLADLVFGIGVEAVQEVMRERELTPVPLASDVVGGLINLRGRIVTAIDLRRRLELPPRPDGEPPMNVVVRTHDGLLSLLVDAIGDVLEVSDALHEPPPPTLGGPIRELVSGVYKLDGHVLLVVETERLIRGATRAA